MASNNNNFRFTKFDVNTIQTAFNNFIGVYSAIVSDKINEFELTVERGDKRTDFGNDREKFFSSYEQDDVDFALLDSGRYYRKKRDENYTFRVKFENPDTSVEISLPSIDDISQVMEVFENATEIGYYQQQEEEVKYDPKDPINQVINGLLSSNPDTRANSADLLGGSGDERSIPALESALYNEKDDNAKRKIIGALGKFNNPKVIPPLRYALKDENTITRHLTVKTLGAVGDTSILRDLVERLGDSDPDIQNSAKYSIENIQIRDLRIKYPNIEEQPKDELYNLLKENEAYLQNENGTPIALKDDAPPPSGVLTPENIEITIRSLADNPSEIDLLGYEDYAKALADFISSAKTEKPLTIGIDAKWGMGKTTLMEMIQKRLAPKPTYPKRRLLSPKTWIRRKKKPKFHTVWFNAWKHDQEETLWSALILETLSKIREKYGFFKQVGFWIKLNWQRFNKRKFWEIVTKYILSSLVLVLLLGAVIYLSLTIFWPKVTLDAFVDKVIPYPAQIGLLAAFSALFKIYQETSKLIAGPFNLKIDEYLKHPNYEEHIGFFVQLEKDFEKIVELITEDGKKPLVIFIDDLDRCEPPNAAEIFEAINLLIGANHCVFVIGMDSQTVAGSIEAKYKDLEKYFDDPEDPGGLSLGHRFIEKIVQINFQIPKSEPLTIEQFIEQNLRIEKGGEEKGSEEEIQEVESLIESEQRAGVEQVDEAANIVQKARPDISNDVISEAKQNIYVKTFDDSPEVKVAIYEASFYLEANPRKIKRFINLFRLKTLIANRRGLIASQDINLYILAKLIVIEMRWPKVLERIISEPRFIKRLLLASSHIKTKLSRIEGTSYREAANEYKSTYDAYQTDIPIRDYLDAGDLHKILEYIPHDLEELIPYYQLAH